MKLVSSFLSETEEVTQISPSLSVQIYIEYFLLPEKIGGERKYHAVQADGGIGSHSVLRDEVEVSRHVHAQSVLSPVEEISVGLGWLMGKGNPPACSQLRY
jgi:hypothetical protein